MNTAFGSLYTPQCGDYVQLLDEKGNPSENHTEVYQWTFELGYHLFVIEDADGESFVVTRMEELDTQKGIAWQQVITAAA